MDLIAILLLAFVSLLVIMSLYQREILKELKEIKKEKQENATTIRKKHVNIQGNNYNSILRARGEQKGYDIFKNQNGLYEPVRPNQGINLKETKED